MARIHLTCGCGWKFFVSQETTIAKLPCPACGAPVATGTPGGVVARQAAEEKAAQARLRLLYKGLGALLVVGGIVALFLSTRTVPVERPVRPSPAAPPPLAEAPRPVEPAPPRPAPPSRAPDPAPPPAPSNPSVRLPAGEVAQLRRSIQEATWLLNLGGIAAEVHLLRGQADDHKKLAALISEWDATLAAAVSRLGQYGERMIVEPHFQPGDRIVGFARKDLTTMAPVDAANALAAWLADFRPPTASEHVVFLRFERKIAEYISFPEETEGLRRLARSPAAVPTTAPAVGPLRPIPESMIQQANRRLGELPKGYRTILPEADRRRLDLLLASRQGTAEDLAFFELRILAEAIPTFERDQAAIRAKAAELEKKLGETTAVDVLHFKDGRRLEGQFLEETEKAVKFRGRFGAVQFPREEVLRVERGRGAGVEFPDRLKATDRKLENLVPLLAWCREKKLLLETEFTATLILTMDPVHEAARAAAGLRRPLSRP